MLVARGKKTRGHETDESRYYRRAFPHSVAYAIACSRVPEDERREWVVAWRDTPDAEPSVHRHISLARPADLMDLVARRVPVNGVHVALQGPLHGGALLFDIDYDSTGPPRTTLCTCAAGSRVVCGACWQSVAVCVKGYVHALREHFGLHQVLVTISGGRGVHIECHDPECFAMSEAERRALYDTLTRDVALTLRNMLLGTARDEYLWHHDGLAALDTPRHARGGSARPPAWILDVYRRVVVPEFRANWVPRMLGAARADDVFGALQVLWVAVGEAHRECATPRGGCTDCALAAARPLAPVALSASMDAAPREVSLETRGAFALLMRMMWLVPDQALLQRSHPLRLPFSVHGRTGRVAICVPPEAIHAYGPGSGNMPRAVDVLNDPTILEPHVREARRALHLTQE